MIRPRFLLWCGRDHRSLEAARAAIAPALSAAGTFAELIDRPGCWLIAERGAALVIPGGVILGPVYRRGTNPRLQPSSSELGSLADGRGRFLIDAHWGGYIAVLSGEEDGALDVIRAPFGDLPCYYVVRPDSVFAASDIDLLARAGASVAEPEWAALARHLAAPDIRRAETCLAGIVELPGGCRLSLGRGPVRRETLWSPWRWATPERGLYDRDEAAARLRDALLHCVGARAADYAKIVLKLSGGLDSSLVAAALAAAKVDTLSLTLVTDNPAGDERRYARLVADTLAMPIVEARRDVAGVDLTRSAAARLPRPTARSFIQESTRLALSAARDAGAAAIFDGGGGDNIFCSLQSVRPATDCLIDLRGRDAFRRTVLGIAQLAQVSAWTVVRRAYAARWRGERAYAWTIDDRLLTPAARDLVGGAADHPWLDAPADALPGKAAHIALITAAQSVAEGGDPQDEMPVVSPLLSQPLIETCLRIPSWQWFEGGHNRAIARQAFARSLPTTITERRSKGGPDSFIVELFDCYRPLIRAIVADGELAKHGLIDRAAALAEIDTAGPVKRHDFLRIMQFVDVEAWLSARRATPSSSASFPSADSARA